MTIAAILKGKKPVVAVGRDTTIRDIARLLSDHRIGAVLVMEREAIVGIVSERDIVRALHLHADILDCTASQIMSSPVHSVPPATPIGRAMGIMTEYRVRHLPVVESGRCQGVVSIGDLVARRIDDAEREASALKEYIQTG